MKKNDRLVLKISSYTYDGMAVAKCDTMPIFVQSMLMDEVGEVVITKVLKNYAFGKCLKLIEKSPERVEPFCAIYPKCGGCQIQHMSAKEQATFKTTRVQDCITRIAKLDLKVKDVISMETPLNYRNKGQVPVGIEDEKVVCGFYRVHSNDIIDMDECAIQHPLINETLQSIKLVLNQYQIGEYFRHLLIKVAFETKQVMVVLIVRETEIPHLDELVKVLSEKSYIKSIILNLNQRNDNVILGEQETVLYGEERIIDQLNDLQFSISSKSFFQVNPKQTVELYNKALELAQLSKKETVLDLYCGIGTITLSMAKHCKEITGIEIVPQAIEDAIQNAKLNNITNASFVCSDAATYANELVSQNKKVDVICVDPPRKGCDEATISALRTIAPKRIIYISCDPATLARDLLTLSEDYKVEQVQPVDMFPHSYHVESVVLLSRKHE